MISVVARGPRRLPFAGLARGTYFIASVEAMERFAYYGMRGLLVLFLTAPVATGGLGWQASAALPAYGYYTAAIWVVPLAGGWLGDRRWGARRCVLIGGWLMTIGLAILSVSSAALLLKLNRQAGDLLDSLPVFAGLGVLAAGVGLLKANIVVLLGELYSVDDERRADAFSLYYVAINVGVVMAALLAGTLGERLGWAYGFAACFVVLACGMTAFSIRHKTTLPASVRTHRPESTESRTQPPRRSGADRTMVLIFALLIFAAIFFAAYEQSGGFINLTIYAHADRSIGSFTVPATWFLALTGVYCILLGPFVPAIFEWMRARGFRTGTVERFALGLFLGGMAFVLFALGLRGNGIHEFNIAWPLLFYLLLTLGELALVPAGFDMASRYAPRGSAGRMMGLWLLSIAAGSIVGGWLGAIGAQMSASVFAATLGAALILTSATLYSLRRRLAALVEL